MFALPALGQGVEDRPSTSLQTKHHNPEVDQSNCTSPGPTEFAHSKIVLVTSCQSLSLSTWLLRLVSEQSPVHSAHEDPNGGKKQIGLRRSPAPTSECVQMSRCQGRKASRSVPSNQLFPMVTVTNDSQNRSTLYSWKFAVP